MWDIVGKVAAGLFLVWAGLIVLSGMALLTFAMTMIVITAVKVIL